jgi:crotonobetainyl-CoA:carnitine CoA-transferase CaiB-like acyl-CoA transferase
VFESKGSPLSGLVVADFSRVLAGPLATMFLADLGATVIKVERPGAGDDTRQWGPPYVGDTTTYFTSVNRNKSSITLDLADPQDQAVAQRLAARADVMVQNFLPGSLDRFGLDAESACSANPGLVYCSITGFGSAAGASLPGYDFIVQAVGGLMSITGSADGAPTKVGVALVDVLTGLHATVGILAALQERVRSGMGQVVEVNLLSSLLSSLVNQASGYLNGGGIPARMGNLHPSVAPYQLLAASDGDIAVAVGNDRQFAVFVDVLGCPELASDSRFARNSDRIANRVALVEALEQRLRAATSATWTQRLHDVGIACGPVNDIAAAVDLAEELGLVPVQQHEPTAGGVPVRTLSNPVRLSRTPVRYDAPPPGLGEQSEAIKEWLARGHQ